VLEQLYPEPEPAADAFAHAPADDWYTTVGISLREMCPVSRSETTTVRRQPAEGEPRELTYVDLRHVLARVLILPSRQVDPHAVRAECDALPTISRLRGVATRDRSAPATP
jgi:hypothetical protein